MFSKKKKKQLDDEGPANMEERNYTSLVLEYVGEARNKDIIHGLPCLCQNGEEFSVLAMEKLCSI